jgi:hypothetical protein
MKKHKFILIVGLLGLIMLIVALIGGGVDFTGNTGVQNKIDSLDVKIEAVGKKPYDAKTFKDINLTIISSPMDESRRSNLKEAYDLSKQKALAIRINKWFKQNCPDATVSEAVAEAQTFSKPIAELQAEMGNYRKYLYALSFSGKLSNFLAGEYNAGIHSSLYADFEKALKGQNFTNCPALAGRLSSMNRELQEFKNFAYDWENSFKTDFKTYKGMLNDPSEKARLNKYSFYLKLFNNSSK